MVKNTNHKSGGVTHYTARRDKAHTTITIRVQKKERDALQKMAISNGRSLSNQLRLILLKNIKAEDDKKNTSDEVQQHAQTIEKI